MRKLYVMGFGPGDEALLTDEVKNILSTADRVFSTGRIARYDNRILSLSLLELKAKLGERAEGITAVLVSGDSGFFSLARAIVRDFSNDYYIETLCGISSVQYFSAKLRIPYDDAAIMSMHGRGGNIVSKAAYNKKVFALTGGANKAQDICRVLSAHGLEDVEVYVGEKLSYADERIVKGTARELSSEVFDDLAVMYIQNDNAANPHSPIRDRDFVRGGCPMTKEEVRWLSIQKMRLMPSDTAYDIGAGTGSVSVEMARQAFDGLVYAVEMKDEGCDLIRQNIARHGAFNIEVLKAKAPDGLDILPAPNAAFIGGSAGNMDGIFKTLLDKNPQVRLVVNAITLQSVNNAVECFSKYGICDTDIICVNVAKAKKLGSYDMMMAQNPVYIISGCRGESDA